MLPMEVYPKIFKKHFRIPRFGSTKIVPYEMYDAQLDFHNKLSYQNIILKARKLGWTTQILAYALVNCNEIPNYHAVFLAHNDPDTKAIFQRVHDFIRHMHNFNVETETSSKTEIRFTRTNATMMIATAGRKSAFRGSDIHFMHFSEIAFFEHPDVYEAVIEAGDKTSPPMVFMETTANGRGEFFKLWELSKTRKEFKQFFYGWNWHPMNKRDVPEGFKKTPDEEEMALEYKLPDEHVNWRRYKLETMPNPEKFPQENPINDSEAFLASGKCVFSVRKLIEMKNFVHEYRLGNLNLNKRGEVDFFAKNDGYLRMFHPPRPGKEYLLTGDVAEGVKGGDASVAYVGDPETGEQCAELWGHMDTDQFTYEVYKLALFYNQPIAAIERNQPGFGVNKDLYNDYKYSRLYMEEKELDSLVSQATENWGFHTNRKTRPLMIDNAIRLIRQGLVKINSIPCIEECLAFVKDVVTGKIEGEKGVLDDRVMAFMIWCYVWGKLPEIRQHHGMGKKSYYDSIGKKTNQESWRPGVGGY